MMIFFGMRIHSAEARTVARLLRASVESEGDARLDAFKPVQLRGLPSPALEC